MPTRCRRAPPAACGLGRAPGGLVLLRALAAVDLPDAVAAAGPRRGAGHPRPAERCRRSRWPRVPRSPGTVLRRRLAASRASLGGIDTGAGLRWQPPASHLGAAVHARGCPLPAGRRGRRALPRAHLAGGLLAGGIAAGFALVPLGGWVSGGARLVRGAALAPWAPAPASRRCCSPPNRPVWRCPNRPGVELRRPPAPSRRHQRGLGRRCGGLWACGRTLERYPRVLARRPRAGGHEPGDAFGPCFRLGSLLLMLSHLCVGPLPAPAPAGRSPPPAAPNRVAAALSGVPPSPAFWGRFAIIAALSTASVGRPAGRHPRDRGGHGYRGPRRDVGDIDDAHGGRPGPPPGWQRGSRHWRR